MICELSEANWESFQISDLFTIRRPASRTIGEYEPGPVRLVAAGRKNNGVVDYVSPKKDDALDPPSSIVVSPLDGYATFQLEPFLGLGGSGSAPIILTADGLDEDLGLFLCGVISKRCSGWSFQDKGSSRKIAAYEIALPADNFGRPYWEFMQAYMAEVREDARIQGERLKQVRSTNHPIEHENWGSFVLGDLASVVKGRRLRKRDMIEGIYPHIGASAVNNGVTRTLGNPSELFEGHCLTVAYDGSIGESFYQAGQFWASDAVNIVRVNDDIDEYAYLFLAAIMRVTGQRYRYTDKWGADRMRKETILLPKTSDSKPDWSQMSRKMRARIERSAERVRQLSTLMRTDTELLG